MSVEIIVRDQQVIEMLQQLNGRLSNMAPVMRQISQAMHKSVTDNFLAGGRPAWDSLRPSTIRNREKIGKWPGQILKVTGQLYSSIGMSSDATMAKVGSNKVYARTMQEGAAKGQFGTVTANIREHLRKGKRVKAHTRQMIVPWGRIPPRPFLTIPEEDLQGIRVMLRNYIIQNAQ